MKTKLEMAHDYAIAPINSNSENMEFDKFIQLCWKYADAMQAEADKRSKAEAEQKRKAAREMLNADNTFLEKEGQHFDDVANQKRTPKVSRFERSDAVKEVLNRAENMGLIKPKEPRETHKNLAEFKMHPEYDASINYPPDAWVMYKGEKRLAVSIDIKKEGQQNQKTYDAKCSKCNSVSSFSRLDGLIHRNRINREFLCVSCPVCQSDVWVDL